MKTLLIALLLAIPVTAYAGEAPGLADLIARTEKESAEFAKDAVPELREKFLRDAAMSLGAQSGLRWRSEEIVKEIDAQSGKLDRVYRFSVLVNEDGLLPPVITEARDSVTVQDNIKRVADRIYRIERDARFVSLPPTWRDYLYKGLAMTGGPVMPHKTLLPKNDAEKSIWRSAMTVGWNAGVTQANEILDRNLALLERDFAGMLTYLKLEKQGMVSRPTVARSDTVVAGNDREMVLGDGVARVRDPAAFQTTTRSWKAPVTPGGGQ